MRSNQYRPIPECQRPLEKVQLAEGAFPACGGQPVPGMQPAKEKGQSLLVTGDLWIAERRTEGHGQGRDGNGGKRGFNSYNPTNANLGAEHEAPPVPPSHVKMKEGRLEFGSPARVHCQGKETAIARKGC